LSVRQIDLFGGEPAEGPAPAVVSGMPVAAMSAQAALEAREPAASAAIDPLAPDLLIIDGTALLFRAFFGHPGRLAPDGVEVGATLGVCHQLLGLLRRQPAAHLAIAFDAGQVTFRNRIDPRYKANRGDPPPELVPQFELVQAAAAALGLPVFARLDFEADDLMATLARLAGQAGLRARLAAIDKDLCQVVRDDAPAVDLCDPKSDAVTDAAGVRERLGVRPEQVVDLMALTGDSTDNVAGVRGVGPKAAVALLDAFGDLDAIYHNLERVEFLGIRGAKALARKLEEGRDEAMLARALVRLDDAVALGVDAAQLAARTRWVGPAADAEALFAGRLGSRGPLHGLQRLFDGRVAAAASA
jgi:DNA polymerase-1